MNYEKKDEEEKEEDFYAYVIAIYIHVYPCNLWLKNRKKNWFSMTTVSKDQEERIEKHSFQAEVTQLLDIVVHSLYTNKEIFVRELVSNASDALEKLRHVQLVEKEIFDDKLDLEINLTTDETAGTITIQDFGVGMSRAELVENLGTIAHSGSNAFLKNH